MRYMLFLFLFTGIHSTAAAQVDSEFIENFFEQQPYRIYFWKDSMDLNNYTYFSDSYPETKNSHPFQSYKIVQAQKPTYFLGDKPIIHSSFTNPNKHFFSFRPSELKSINLYYYWIPSREVNHHSLDIINPANMDVEYKNNQKPVALNPRQFKNQSQLADNFFRDMHQYDVNKHWITDLRNEGVGLFLLWIGVGYLGYRMYTGTYSSTLERIGAKAAGITFLTSSVLRIKIQITNKFRLHRLKGEQRDILKKYEHLKN